MDVWRCQGAVSPWHLLKSWFGDPAFRPVLSLRVVQALDRSPCVIRWWLMPFARIWHRRQQRGCGVDLPWRMQVGAGFKLLHGWGVVINDEVRIGNNVTIMQGVTVGGTGRGIPVIEDGAIICANATVIGGIVIGANSVVGAGCVVTKSFPAGATVIGNPQREIARATPVRGYNAVPAPMLKGRSECRSR